jgi:hypothetical protein
MRKKSGTMSVLKAAINLGTWTEEGIDELLERTAQMTDLSAKIAAISRQFLGAEYGESTLIGDMHSPEVLVVNLERVDCFTFIDYVEALRLSRSFGEFRKNLVKVRYQSGKVSYLRRKHFFTDWIEFNGKHVTDVTGVVGGQAAERTVKTLNVKEDGTFFLKGIAPRSREITYIPAKSVDEDVFEKLRTGDYAGIYSDKEGLDVSHVGIIIRDNETVLLRHASSLQSNRRVIDQDLGGYLADKPGLVVLRPKIRFEKPL